MIMLQQMIILFIVMMVGLIANKIDIISGDATRKFSKLVVNVTNPCFVLSSVLGDTDAINGKDLLTIACISITMFTVLIILAVFIPKLLRVPKESRGVYKAMMVFNNLGFMGAPIVAGMYGSEAVLFVAMFVLPFNVLVYTYGVLVIKGKSEDGNKLSILSIINPGVVSSVLAIVIYLTHIQLPTIFSTGIQMIGNITAPLSMMVIGASFATMNFKKIFTNVRLLTFCLIKLIIIPVVGICIVRIFVNNPQLLGIFLIMIATPVGSMVPMLATTYGADSELSSIGVAVTTILSVATLPLLFLMLGI
ncbi:MAG: AEC family transporter [Eubacteriales bacterium]|nr:AEC family transporter [Eubacteriales bacterium]